MGKLVPQLRFKGFTDPWEQRKLSTCLTESVIPGHSGDQAKKLTVRLWGKGVVEKTTLQNGSSATQYYVRKSGQLMYGKLDFLHAAFGIVPQELDGHESTADSPAFDIADDVDKEFVLQSCLRKELYLYQGSLADGSRKAKRVHSQTFLQMTANFPSLEEQQKITELFRTMDDLIAAHERKLELLRLKKRYYLQQIFSRKLRFRGFTEPWQQRKLGDLYEKSSEKNDGSYGIDAIISVANMRFKADASLRDESYLKTYNIMRLGDIAFEGNRSRHYSHGRFVENDIGDGIVSHVFEVLRPTEDRDLVFWKYYINDEHVMRNILIRSTKATTMMHTIVINDFLREKLDVPSDPGEQQIIGKFLVCLDALIDSYQTKKTHLDRLKTSYLQKLFV